MKKNINFTEDESGAATELGYVFTFLLGLLLLSLYSLWEGWRGTIRRVQRPKPVA